MPHIILMQQDIEVQRKIIEILRILKKHSSPVGARTIAKELTGIGYLLNERTVRYHLKLMDENGLTKNHGYSGRTLTEKGLEELNNALVSDRIGFVLSRIENLSYGVTYDPFKNEGKIAINTSLVEKNNIEDILRFIKEANDSKMALSPLIKVIDETEVFDNFEVPENYNALYFPCSFTIDGVLIRSGIPVAPILGGMVQIENYQPIRFIEAIKYEGCSLDPLELFIGQKRTSVHTAIAAGSGVILANLREIPLTAKENTQKIFEKMETRGFGGILQVGEPNNPVLSIPVSRDKVGIAIVGGINQMAAIEESGISTNTSAIETLIDIREMKNVNNLI